MRIIFKASSLYYLKIKNPYKFSCEFINYFLRKKHKGFYKCFG